MKKRFKQIHVIFCTILLLSTVYLNVIPKSYSKYISKKEEALIYNTNLYQLNQGSVLNKDGKMSLIKKSANYISDYQFAYIEVQFPRSEVYSKGKADKYILNIPDACDIVNIKTDASSNNMEKHTITYSKEDTELDNLSNNNTVVMKCTVDDLLTENGTLNVPVTIKEKIGKESEFIYMSGNYAKLNYPADFPTPSDNAIVEDTYLMLPISGVTESELASYYATFQTWIDRIGANASSVYEISEYFKSQYPDGASIIDEANPDNVKSKLNGLTVRRNETGDGKIFYEYKIDENFVGYAKTYEFYQRYNLAPADYDRVVYFSGTNEDVNDVMDYYLKTYIYPGDDENCTLISDYIKKQGGILKVLNEEIEIPGLEKFVDSVIIWDSIKDHAYNSQNISNEYIRISHFTDADMQEVLEKDVQFMYEELISSNTIKKIIENQDIIDSVIKNNSSVETKEIFNDYFIEYDEDNGYHILVNVNSNGIDYNYLVANKLVYNNNITFEKMDDGSLSVTITYKTNVSETVDVIEDLKRYFSFDLVVNYITKQEEQTVNVPDDKIPAEDPDNTPESPDQDKDDNTEIPVDPDNTPTIPDQDLNDKDIVNPDDGKDSESNDESGNDNDSDEKNNDSNSEENDVNKKLLDGNKNASLTFVKPKEETDDEEDSGDNVE